MAESFLTTALARARQRLLRIGLGAALVWALIIGAAVVLLGAWIDLAVELSPALRLAFVLAATAALIAAVAWLVRATFGAGVPLVLARRLDHVADAGGSIVAGVDLLLQPPQGPVLTTGLAQLAISRAAALAERVEPRSVVSARPVGRPLFVLAGFGLLVLVLALLAPRMALTQWLRFTDPFGDHPPYSPIMFAVEPGDVDVAYGDGLDVRAHVSGAPVDRVELVVRPAGRDADETTLPMFAEADGTWRSTLVSVTEPGRYFVRARGARSHQQRIGVLTVPRLENVRFKVTQPAYTHLPPYEGALPANGLSGLPGARVEVRATSNRPLSGGKLTVALPDATEDCRVVPVASGAREVQATFAIRQSGNMDLRVADVDGQLSRDVFAASVTALTDQRPFVRILEPRALSLATPKTVLPVVIAAEDDYGVGGVQLFRSLNDSRPLPMNVALSETPLPHEQCTVGLPLDRYALRPGDVIKLFARVEDNDPTGAKGAESEVVTVRIIAQEEFERLLRTQQGMELLQSKYGQGERRLERLSEELAELAQQLAQDPHADAAAAQRERMKELAEQLQREAKELDDATDLDLPYDVDKALNEKLHEVARELMQAAEQLNNTLAAQPLKAGQAAEELQRQAERLRARRKQFAKEVTEPLEYLAKVLPLKQDESRFLQLYEKQRSLAERLASLKGHDQEDSPQLKARMRELEDEQARLRADLGQLLDDIAAHADVLPEDAALDDLRQSARKFVQAVRESGAADAMSACENGLAEFSGTRGHAGAEQAADILKQFISQCQGMGEQAGSCLKFSPSLSGCLGNSVEQMLADMGLGNGMGTGAGGGYSAARSALDNVGLYGALPTLDATGSRGGAADAAGVRAGRIGPQMPGFATASVETEAELRASGAAQTPVPPAYRRRVGEYFRRIAEELDQP